MYNSDSGKNPNLLIC